MNKNTIIRCSFARRANGTFHNLCWIKCHLKQENKAQNVLTWHFGMFRKLRRPKWHNTLSKKVEYTEKQHKFQNCIVLKCAVQYIKLDSVQGFDVPECTVKCPKYSTAHSCIPKRTAHWSEGTSEYRKNAASKVEHYSQRVNYWKLHCSFWKEHCSTGNYTKVSFPA